MSTLDYPALKKTPLSHYTVVEQIGKGCFGTVFLAKDADGSLAAIKRIELDANYKFRELEIIKSLDHSCCLRHMESCEVEMKHKEAKFVYIATNYFPMDLHKFMTHMKHGKQDVPMLIVKVFAYQILCGLRYIHQQNIMHRDIKLSNIVVDTDSWTLCICDFGSAKYYTEQDKNAPYIGSRHYRAPELILGMEKYDYKVDIWAAGCVIGEMITASTMFPGETSAKQFDSIIEKLGIPSEEELAFFGREKMIMTAYQKTTLEEQIHDKEAVNLLKKMFRYVPSERATADECLKMPFFDELFQEGTRLPDGRDLPPLEPR